jgi:hypothetical protein
MKKKRRIQSHSNFGYYGFGNVSSVFNRKPKPIFERLKTIYGDEMERSSYKKDASNKFHQQLTKKEKEEIKKRVRATFKRTRQLEIFKVISFFAIILFLIFLVFQLVYS